MYPPLHALTTHREAAEGDRGHGSRSNAWTIAGSWLRSATTSACWRCATHAASPRRRRSARQGTPWPGCASMAWGVPIGRGPCRPSVLPTPRATCGCMRGATRPWATVCRSAARAMRSPPRAGLWCGAPWPSRGGRRQAAPGAASPWTRPAWRGPVRTGPPATRRPAPARLATPKTTVLMGHRGAGRCGSPKTVAGPVCATGGRALRRRRRGCRSAPRP